MGNLKLLLIFQPWLFPFWSFLAFHYFSLLLRLSMLMLRRGGDVVLLVRNTHCTNSIYIFNARILMNYWQETFKITVYSLVILVILKASGQWFYYFGDIIDLLHTKTHNFYCFEMVQWFYLKNHYWSILSIMSIKVFCWFGFGHIFHQRNPFNIYSAPLYKLYENTHTTFLLFYTLKTTYKIHHFLAYSSCCKYHMQSCFAQESIAKPLMSL